MGLDTGNHTRDHIIPAQKALGLALDAGPATGAEFTQQLAVKMRM